MLSSKIIRKISFLFSGAAIVWWSFLIYFIVSTISQFLVDYVRNIVIMHLAIVLFAVLGNYLYMRYVSKELNEGEWKKKLVLLEDLEQKPRNEDEFMECIISYCKKNALDLEVFQYGIPAKVKMGDELYEVKLVEYCSLSNGIVSALEFRLYGIPAKVKMGDELYEVKLVEYCSLSNGIVSALEFRLTEE